MTIPDDTIQTSLPSGRFNLRIDPELHASLREAAASAGTSLNEYCARKLASPGTLPDSAMAAVVRRAAKVLADSLMGVVAFGSWARGEETGSSDLDVLVVADGGVPVSRALYRRWDSGPELNWGGHEVTPHFARLPTKASAASGLWAEVARDGLVLFEREFMVSRYLAGVRRRILRGKLSARVADGQRYWVHEP
jgi:uncharacterized protein (DUF1778 family)